MSISEPSCSDCKIEFIQKKWLKLLLKWINKCVNDNTQKRRVKRLSPVYLSDIMTKYKNDVCDDDIDRAMLCTDDIEPFIKFKYPMLRLRYITEEQDLPKKIYIMTSMLLFHCCMHSHSGEVHDDIYHQLTKYEQELVLKFCENLREMETTMNNVELAIQDAFHAVFTNDQTSIYKSYNNLNGKESSDTAAHMSSTSTIKSSATTLPSDITSNDDTIKPEPVVKFPPLKFTSSITVLPSVVTDTSTYSDMMIESDEQVAEKDIYVDSEEMNMYNLESVKEKIKKDSKRDLTEYQRDDKDRNSQKTQKEYERKRQEDNIIVSRQQTYEKKDENASQKQKETVCAQKEIIANNENDLQATDSKNPRCLADCSCARCSAVGPCCGDPGSTMGVCACSPVEEKPSQPVSSKLAILRLNRKITAMAVAVVLFIILVAVLSTIIPLLKAKKELKALMRAERFSDGRPYQKHTWKCQKKLCQKVFTSTNEKIYTSHSRCSLICTGPQIWPIPIGQMDFSSKIVALATNKLEYKLKTVTSESVHRHLAEAFKLFIGDLAKLEKSGHNTKTDELDLDVKKMNIQIEVESDPDPRLRVNTEEAYQLKFDTKGDQVVIQIYSSSFCGVRHGLETLTQMIILDEKTGYLITVTSANIKDAPSYKYRGLMIDTGRNYIPVENIMRTIDAMATVKLNTFHWRISDVTSFPLFLPKLSQLFEHGAYDRSMIYTKNDVETVVKRAGVRGIRVLIEVAVPGPVGRPWSWSMGASCRTKNNDTCENMLCMTLDTQDSVMDVLQTLYEEILEMTQVDDIFHLSNGVFSLSHCYNLLNGRDGFLDKALDSLKRANKGFLPKLPVIWYTPQLDKDFESNTWERFGVQLHEWKSNPSEQFVSKFKVIHSSKWDLSCEMKKQRCKKYRNWQEMYSWKSWRNVEAFTVEGGEAILWTDLVDSGNLDYHVWPRTAAVAERLWSDIVANTSADGSVYVRLNSHRSRMLRVGVNAHAIWPKWCTYNPGPCLIKVR